MTKSQLSTQQQQREVLRQLAAEQSYDPTGKRKVIKYFNIPFYLYVYAPGTKIMCLLQAMCASSSSKFRTAYKNKRPRRAAARASITVGSWPVSDCVIVSNKRKKI